MTNQHLCSEIRFDSNCILRQKNLVPHPAHVTLANFRALTFVVISIPFFLREDSSEVRLESVRYFHQRESLSVVFPVVFPVVRRYLDEDSLGGSSGEVHLVASRLEAVGQSVLASSEAHPVLIAPSRRGVFPAHSSRVPAS